MDCSDVSCPYITGSNVDLFECVLPSNEVCERLENDGIPDCEDCEYFVNVGGYHTYCRLSRCIDADYD